MRAGCLEAISAPLISPQGFLFSFFIYASLRICLSDGTQISVFVCLWECRREEFWVYLVVGADIFGGFKSLT